LDADTEVAAPEWQPNFHQILIYETAMELVAEYPLMKRDMINLSTLKKQLSAVRHTKQVSTPATIRDGRLYNNASGYSRSDLDDNGCYDYN